MEPSTLTEAIVRILVTLDPWVYTGRTGDKNDFVCKHCRANDKQGHKDNCPYLIIESYLAQIDSEVTKQLG